MYGHLGSFTNGSFMAAQFGRMKFGNRPITEVSERQLCGNLIPVMKFGFVPGAAIQVGVGAQLAKPPPPAIFTRNIYVIYFVDLFIEGHILFASC